MTQDEAIKEAFDLLIGAMNTLKERHRSDGTGLGRRYAITVTLIEQAYAYYLVYVSKCRK